MNPFATALRVQQREVDAVRVSIRGELDLIVQAETEGRALDEQLRVERAIAAAQYWAPAPEAWNLRMEARRTRLETQRVEAEARLQVLREEAAEAFGKLRAIAVAAERHREEEDKAAAVAEQSSIDDVAAARFIRRQSKKQCRA